MIRKIYHWIHSINKKNEELDKKTAGKWIVRGTKKKLGGLFKKINELVDAGKINGAKCNLKNNLDTDLLPYSEPVICIYADDNSKEKTLELLREIGISPKSWKYSYETYKDWKKGGKLYEESLRQRAAYIMQKSSKQY